MPARPVHIRSAAVALGLAIAVLVPTAAFAQSPGASPAATAVPEGAITIYSGRSE